MNRQQLETTLVGLLGVLVTVTACHPAMGQTTQPAAAEAESPPGAFLDDLRQSKTLTGDWGGVRSDLKDAGLKLSLSYQHQFQQNFHGGLDTHNAHRQTGSYDLKLELDFEKMGLIENAGFYIKAKGTWSESDLVGINSDKVGASGAARVNSDASNDQPIYVNKWWYWHRFLDDKIELRLGQIETVKDVYDVSLYANHEDKDFLNRLSFRNATIPHRIGMGANLKIMPVDWFYIQAGAFDAQSRKRRTGFDTAFHDEAWFLGLGELGFTPKWDSAKGPMPGRYRAGLWYDPKLHTVFRDDLDGRLPTINETGHVGYYFGFDQMVWKENEDPKDSQGLGLFGRYGHGSRDVYKISDYWSAGLSYKGLLPDRDKDVFGFGVAQAIYSGEYRDEIRERADRETVYEWYYKCYVTPWLIISPDLQVITHPGGDKDDRNAVVGGVRLRVIF